MRGMRKGILATVATVAVAAGSAAPAQAASTQRCGGTWGDGEQVCTFDYDGGGILVRINKSDGVFGSVRLETGDGVQRRVHLLCDALLGPCVMATYSPEDLFPIGTELRCVSHGAAGSGRFECVSGEEFGG